MARADHIIVPRLGGLFTHHGIDCGDGTVIHFTGDTWTTPRSVQRTSFAEFTQGEPWQVRDYSNFFGQLNRPEHLPRRLRIQLRLDFDLVLNNCEHFATWCKTGMSDSEQVYALWRPALDPMTYLRLRRADLLTSVFEAAWRPPTRPAACFNSS